MRPACKRLHAVAAALVFSLLAASPVLAQRGGGGGPQPPQPVRSPRFEYVGPVNAGRIAAAAAVAGKLGVYFAGAASGGVWKTTDGGATWKPTTRAAGHAPGHRRAALAATRGAGHVHGAHDLQREALHAAVRGAARRHAAVEPRGSPRKRRSPATGRPTRRRTCSGICRSSSRRQGRISTGWCRRSTRSTRHTQAA